MREWILAAGSRSGCGHYWYRRNGAPPHKCPHPVLQGAGPVLVPPVVVEVGSEGGDPVLGAVDRSRRVDDPCPARRT